MASALLSTQPSASVIPADLKFGLNMDQLERHAIARRMGLVNGWTCDLVRSDCSIICKRGGGLGKYLSSRSVAWCQLPNNPLSAPLSGLGHLHRLPQHFLPHLDTAAQFPKAPRMESTVGVLSQAASLFSLATNSTSKEAKKLEAEAEATPVSPDLPPIICFPGGGMFFYWMIGVVNVLQEHIDLTKAHMSGASAGALASVLAACGVDMQKAAKHALQLSIDDKLWDRKLKLALVWGKLIRQWLWDLLPENAAELCNGRVHLFILELPGMQTGLQCKRVPINDFKNKGDLIDCALASVHIPIFINGHVWTEYRGLRCVDGSINADRLALNIDPRRHTLYIDPYEDPEMKERGNRFLELYGDNPGPEGTWEWIEYMMQRGEEHARKITKAGQLESWKSKSLNLAAGG